MESENQDTPDLPPRPPKRINMNEELAKTISSELNSRLSSIRTSGSAATPSRISGVHLDVAMHPTRSETTSSDLFLDAEDEFVDDIPPPIPPRGAGVRVSDINIEDFDLPDSGPPPPVPPRGSDVRVSDENLDDFDIPDKPPSLPPRRDDVKVSDENLDDFDIPDKPPSLPPRRNEPEEKSSHPPIPARNYHPIEEDEEDNNNDSKLNEEIKELERKIEKMEKELKAKDETISDLKTENNRLCSEIKYLKDENRTSGDKVKQLKQQIESLKSENEKLKTDNENLKQKNKQLKIDVGVSERPRTPTKSPSKSPTKSPSKSPTKSPIKSPTKSPSKNAPAIPPKPSKKVCETMIQNASVVDTDEYDLGTQKDSINEGDEEGIKDSGSINNSVELLPGTSSRPLVLPTKSCVRKRGNRLSSAITERKSSSKRATSSLVEEPSNFDIDSPVSATTPSSETPIRSLSTKQSKENTKSSMSQQSPAVPVKPPHIPSRSSERKVSNSSHNHSLYDDDDNDDELEIPVSQKISTVSTQIEKEDRVEDDMEDNFKEKDEEEKIRYDDEEEVNEENDDVGEMKEEPEPEPEPEPEINPTLSRIHKIGRPSMLPEGGLSSIKLRSRREDSRSSHKLERLDEDTLKKWIFATVKKDEIDGNLFEILHDGQLLCELINTIRSDKQIVPKKGKMRPWHIVNINAYLSGCVDLHIQALFKAEDLYEGEELDRIIDNLSELKFYADSRK